jgi:hypothetical protein
MKFTKFLFTAIGAAVVTNVAAFADGQMLVQIPNGHGQSTALYRSTEPTVALFTGRGVGTASSTGQLKTESKDNGHGQAITMNRLVQ